jgi:hypothetical protein
MSEEDVGRIYAVGEALVRAALDDPEWMAARRAKMKEQRTWDTPEQRFASALHLLEAGAGPTVQPPDPDLGDDVTWVISFDDVAAIEFADLVRLTIDRLGRLEGVDGVEADDRDLIAVSGPVPREQLDQAVTGWWDHWLRGVIGDEDADR